MATMRLAPRHALSYPGTRLNFLDESSVAYCFGSAVRITHLLPDKVPSDTLYTSRMNTDTWSRQIAGTNGRQILKMPIKASKK